MGRALSFTVTPQQSPDTTQPRQNNVSRRRSAHPIFARLRRRRAVSLTQTPTASATPTATDIVAFVSLFSDPTSATVLTPEDEPISLLDHVRERNDAGETVLLGWLRHFGCSLCKKQTADWQAIRPRLEECGNVCITLIGNGPPRHAKDFIEEMNWTGPLFTDPDRRTYKTLQFRAGLSSTFNLPALGKVITSFREGNPQTWKRMPTDAFQQGGAILVDKNGSVRLFHADAFAGDHLGTDSLLEKVRAVAE